MVFTFESDRLWDGLDLYQSGNLLLFFKGLQTVPSVTATGFSVRNISEDDCPLTREYVTWHL